MNFHPPFSEPPSFFFFLIPQILRDKNNIIGICVRLKFENVNYSSEINHADVQTSNTSTRLWFYYIITKIHPPFQNPGSAPAPVILLLLLK